MDSQPANALATRPAPPEAPQGWSVGWSETHKRWYFVNIESNVTQWKRPEQATQQHPQQAASAAVQDVNAPSESPLPAGWTSHWSEEHHHYYFLNAATGKSQWEPPQPEKPRDTADLPSQLRLPTQAKHARSSSQPPLRSGSKSEHKQGDSTPGDLFSDPQSRERKPASEDEFHIDRPERPKSHVFAPFEAAQPANTGVYTPPMWSYGVPESTNSSPGIRGRSPPAELAAPFTAGTTTGQALTPSPPRMSPRLSPQHAPVVPSALNPFSQGPTGAFLNPADISRPSSRNSETEILPAYSYSPGFSSKYSSYQPAAPEDSKSQKRFSAWNPDMNVIAKEPAVAVVHHPENYDFLP